MFGCPSKQYAPQYAPTIQSDRFGPIHTFLGESPEERAAFKGQGVAFFNAAVTRYGQLEAERLFAEIVEDEQDQVEGKRHFNEESTLIFAANYMRGEKEAGRKPTKAGLERAAKNAGYGLGKDRDLIRAAFDKLAGPAKRGRPLKNSPN